MVMGIVPRNIYFVMAVEAFIRQGPLMRAIGGIEHKRDDSLYGERIRTPFERITKLSISKDMVDAYEHDPKKSYGQMMAHLKHGDAIVIMPEGEPKVNATYKGNPDFLPFQEGFAVVALMAERNFKVRIPIIPIGFYYERRMLRIGYTVQVRIGQPMHLDVGPGRDIAERVRPFVQAVEARVRELSQPTGITGAFEN